jgi:hypothetical protein
LPHGRRSSPEGYSIPETELGLAWASRPTMGFGHVGIHRPSISRILPGSATGNAEVRTVALNRIHLEAAPSTTTRGQSSSNRTVGNRVPLSQFGNGQIKTKELPNFKSSIGGKSVRETILDFPL